VLCPLVLQYLQRSGRPVCLLMLMLLLLSALPAAAQTGAIRGVVTAADTGAPVAGATVQIGTLTTTTDTDGVFLLGGLPAGEHDVRVQHAPAGRYGTTRVTVGPKQTTDIRVTLAMVVREVITVSAIDVRDLLSGGGDGTPGAAASVSAAELRRLRPFSVHEAMAVLPGVRTIDDDAFGRRSGIGIRGAPPRRSRRVLLLEDGVPVNAATYLDPSAHYTPPIERLDRIEALKGAGQLVHGPLNNHGVINFRSAQATSTPATTFDAGLGSAGTFRRHAMHTRTVGRAGLVLAYSGLNGDGVFDVEDHRYDDWFGSTAWQVNDRHELSGSFTYFRERSNYDERNLSLDEFARDPRSKRQLNSGADANTFAIDYLKGHVTHQFRVDSQLTLTSHVFATTLDRPRFETRAGGPLADGGYMRGRERRYGTTGAASRAAWHADDGRLWQSVQAGLRWERQSFDNRNTVGALGDTLTTGNRGELATADGVTFLEHGRREQLEAWAMSLFVQSTMAAGPVSITPGVRVERYRQIRSVRFRPGSTVPFDEHETRTLVLPGIGLRFALGDTTDLHAGVHRGYSPAIARTEDFPLLPETGVDVQIGVRSRVIRGVTLDLAGYSNRLQNTIVKRTFTDQFGANVFVNSGQSHIRGLDMGLRAESRPLAGDGQVFAHVVYNLADARFTTSPVDGKQVPEIARHSGNATLGFTHGAGWSTSVSLLHSGGFHTDELNTLALSTPDPDEPLEIIGRVPGHSVWSARTTVPLTRSGWTFWVQVRNLTNRLYISDLQDGLRPGAGRVASSGLRVTF
jgi:Fe(3+) dicitrate transport protein